MINNAINAFKGHLSYSFYFTFTDDFKECPLCSRTSNEASNLLIRFRHDVSYENT
jgi:hypothetical protein